MKKILSRLLLSSFLVFSLLLPAFALNSYNSIVRNTATGTSAGATATVSASTTSKHHLLHAIGYTDSTSLILIKDGTATILTIQTGAGGFDIEMDGALIGTINTAMSAVIVTSTSACSITLVSGLL